MTELVRIRQKTPNAPDVTVSRGYAEGLGDDVEILEGVAAVDGQGRPLDPTPKAATPKKAAPQRAAKRAAKKAIAPAPASPAPAPADVPQNPAS